jgi:hypothetical protein
LNLGHLSCPQEILYLLSVGHNDHDSLLHQYRIDSVLLVSIFPYRTRRKCICLDAINIS